MRNAPLILLQIVFALSVYWAIGFIGSCLHFGVGELMLASTVVQG